MDINLEEKKNLEKATKFMKKSLPFIKVVVVLSVGIFLGYLYYPNDNVLGNKFNAISTNGEVGGSCNVIGINIHGTIQTYLPEHAEGDPNFDYDSIASENIVYLIEQANKDPEVKAVILEINSPGGSPMAGEEMSIAVTNSEKPIFAYIREIGASAAYFTISGADKIWASKYSDVGGIGVTMSYLNNTENNKKEGYTYEKLSAGKFKDSGSPDLPLSKEERDLFMRDVNIMHKNFMEAVSINRNISLEKVKSFADGSTVLGEQAKKLGLIDEIGGMPEVKKYVEEQIGEKPVLCWE